MPRVGPAPPSHYTTKHHWSVIPDIRSASFPDSVWKDWEEDKCPLSLTMPPWLDPDALIRIARDSKFPDMDRVLRTAESLRSGVRTGVEGAGRLPLGQVKNSPSLAKLPVQVLDQLRTWTKKGLLCGPVHPDELPPGAKHAPLSAVLKPLGDARLINNQSFPHLKKPDKWGKEPVSFNSGIDSTRYPTLQITSKAILKRLARVGAGSKMCKIDWSDAYVSHN